MNDKKIHHFYVDGNEFWISYDPGDETFNDSLPFPNCGHFEIGMTGRETAQTVMRINYGIGSKGVEVLKHAVDTICKHAHHVEKDRAATEARKIREYDECMAREEKKWRIKKLFPGLFVS